MYYSFTVTPFRFFRTPAGPFGSCDHCTQRQLILKAFYLYRENFTLITFEVGTNGITHCHGIVSFDNYRQVHDFQTHVYTWFKMRNMKLTGADVEKVIKMDHLAQADDYNRYMLYCLKDQPYDEDYPLWMNPSKIFYYMQEADTHGPEGSLQPTVSN